MTTTKMIATREEILEALGIQADQVFTDLLP